MRTGILDGVILSVSPSMMVGASGKFKKRTFILSVQDGGDDKWGNPITHEYEFELMFDKADWVTEADLKRNATVEFMPMCRYWDGNGTKKGRYFTSLQVWSVKFDPNQKVGGDSGYDDYDGPEDSGDALDMTSQAYDLG